MGLGWMRRPGNVFLSRFLRRRIPTGARVWGCLLFTPLFAITMGRSQWRVRRRGNDVQGDIADIGKGSTPDFSLKGLWFYHISALVGRIDSPYRIMNWPGGWCTTGRCPDPFTGQSCSNYSPSYPVASAGFGGLRPSLFRPHIIVSLPSLNPQRFYHPGGHTPLVVFHRGLRRAKAHSNSSSLKCWNVRVE